MVTPEGYWRKTGYKFYGKDEDFEKIYTECTHSMPWADEEGYFNSFLCIKDCKECDFLCSKHFRINPDIKEFVDSLNRSLENVKAY